jgi:two-component system response regulator
MGGGRAMDKGSVSHSMLGTHADVMQKRYILQVEDSADDAALTRHALRRAEISNRVELLKDGVEALDFVCRRGKYFDRDANDLPAFVLLDLKLPKVDGFEVLKNFKENEPMASVPVVIFTSSREERDLLKAYELKANSYVRKPVDFDRFTEVIRQIGFYWLSLNEIPHESRK